jgi:hypothetical protein
MANSQKVVDVPDVGVVAFPGDMEDDHISNAIKLFRAQKKTKSLTTEDSEHARQLKPAQPLDSAIPHLPEWANKPVLSSLTFDAQIQRAEKSNHPEQADWLRKQKALQDKSYEKNKANHPIATGIGTGVGEFAEGMTSPANLALIAGAPESKLLSGFFAVQALSGSFRSAQEAQEAYLKGNNPDAARYATQAALGLGVAGLAGAHAIKDVPSPVTENPVGRVTSGDIGNSRAYAVHDPTGTLIGKLKVSSPGLGREGVDASVKELGKLGIHSQDMVEVGGSNIRAGFQGKGYGKQMYEEMIKSETAKGKTVVSDLSGATTPDAARVWEGLVRRGLAKKVGNIYYSSPRETGGQK